MDIHNFDTVESCGLVVFKGNHVLLIKRRDKWDLPKGKHEEGEHYREPAVKTTHWFLAKYKGPNDHVLIPQDEEDIQDVQWVSLSIIGQYLPEMRGYARYILELTLNVLKIEQQRLKEKLTWGDC